MKSLRIHYIQHVPFEGLAYIETWATQHGHGISHTKTFNAEPFPELSSFDWLIVMGGSMGVYEEEKYPWLAAEKELVRQAIAAQKVVLGICLGAQMMASALGARVYPNPKKEIGWWKVELQQAPIWSSSNLVQTLFQWHGDTFDIPQGATKVASSSVCPNQAFMVGDRALALQFHLEVTPHAIEALCQNCLHEIVDDAYIQPYSKIVELGSHIPNSNALMQGILDYFQSIS